MPGTRTAPTIDGNPTFVRVSMKFVDREDKQTAIAFEADSAALNSTVESAVAAAQVISNASLWEVEVAPVYRGARLASNALGGGYMSVADRLRISYAKTSLDKIIRAYVPAVLQVVINEGGSVDTTNTDYQDFRDDILACLPSGYAAQSTGFVQNVQRNQSQGA